MLSLNHQKRFTVSLVESDYVALLELGRSVTPSLNLQYMVRLAVRNLLEKHESMQLPFPLDRSR